MEVRETDSGRGMNRQSCAGIWPALLLVAGLFILAAIFAGVAQWVPPEAEAVVAIPKVPAQPDLPAASFEYFPDGYVNQATRIEEPIQAF